MEVGKSNTFGVQAVDARGSKVGIAEAGEVSVTLIIGQDKDNVRPRSLIVHLRILQITLGAITRFIDVTYSDIAS